MVDFAKFSMKKDIAGLFNLRGGVAGFSKMVRDLALALAIIITLYGVLRWFCVYAPKTKKAKFLHIVNTITPQEKLAENEVA